MDVANWEPIIRRILELPNTKNEANTYVYTKASPRPKYVGDEVVEYGGKLPTGFDSIKMSFKIGMIDEINPNPNKPLGKYFMLAWAMICCIKGVMYDWPEILEEIKTLASFMKRSCAKVNRT